jgi:hypothetical protein
MLPLQHDKTSFTAALRCMLYNVADRCLLHYHLCDYSLATVAVPLECHCLGILMLSLYVIQVMYGLSLMALMLQIMY